MWEEIKKMESFKKFAVVNKGTKKKDLLEAIRGARIYFGNVLNSTIITGYMEEYLYRG